MSVGTGWNDMGVRASVWIEANAWRDLEYRRSFSHVERASAGTVEGLTIARSSGWTGEVTGDRARTRAVRARVPPHVPCTSVKSTASGMLVSDISGRDISTPPTQRDTFHRGAPRHYRVGFKHTHHAADLLWQVRRECWTYP